jgi:hypothetical protein
MHKYQVIGYGRVLRKEAYPPTLISSNRLHDEQMMKLRNKRSYDAGREKKKRQADKCSIVKIISIHQLKENSTYFIPFFCEMNPFHIGRVSPKSYDNLANIKK